MSQPAESYEQIYARLKAEYVERLRKNLSEIKIFSQKLTSEPIGRNDLLGMQSLSHGLAGSGTTFGFPEVTSQGRRVEQFLDKLTRVMDDESIMDEDSVSAFKAHLNELCDQCEKAQTISAMPDSDLALKGGGQAPSVLDGRKRINVLVVDDDRSLTSLVSLKLTQRNFGVMTAHNGHEALAAIRERKPDIILLDVNMPLGTGHDVLRSVKQDPELSGIPVLMLTASAKEDDVVGALHSGAIDYIVKPIDINVLAERIENVCKSLSRTILLADNDQLILTLLNHKFRSRGLNVLLADNGVSALEEVRRNKPDLVVLDIRMPGMDGFAVLRSMRDDASTKSIPVIILSASREKNDVDEAKVAGAQDYVTKPFLADTLLARCMKILNKEQ